MEGSGLDDDDDDDDDVVVVVVWKTVKYGINPHIN
jgi:hypothetical protein